MIEIPIDVSVIELDRGQDQRIRVVVEEFGGLIEEGGVVFVAFNDKCRACALTERTVKVEGDPTDKKRRVPPGREQ